MPKKKKHDCFVEAIFEEQIAAFQVRCSCGGVSSQYPTRAEADAAKRKHLAQYGEIRFSFDDDLPTD